MAHRVEADEVAGPQRVGGQAHDRHRLGPAQHPLHNGGILVGRHFSHDAAPRLERNPVRGPRSGPPGLRCRRHVRSARIPRPERCLKSCVRWCFANGLRKLLWCRTAGTTRPCAARSFPRALAAPRSLAPRSRSLSRTAPRTAACRSARGPPRRPLPHCHRPQCRLPGTDLAHRPGAAATRRFNPARQTAGVLPARGHLLRGQPTWQA